MPIHDVIVLGAGVAGLQCARRLKTAGSDVLVLDRSDKPGGRCATRLFDGEPADYGPLFIHGDDAGFLAAVKAVPAERVEGWPARVSGRGAPCQPDAFTPLQTRLAFVEGVNAFPRSLAEGLNVRLRAQASSVGIDKDSAAVFLEGGERVRGRDLVLALALEQSVPFVRMLESADGARGASGVLEMFGSLPCLTVVAGYEPSAPLPAWDVCYPEDEPALLLVGNESSKRPKGQSRVLVLQASASWSHKRLQRPKDEWARELLDVAARRLGAWAATPRWTHPHRWKYSQVDRANELAGPLELRIGDCRVGIIGDLFAPGGGMQAAWLSGDRLAARLLK